MADIEAPAALQVVQDFDLAQFCFNQGAEAVEHFSKEPKKGRVRPLPPEFDLPVYHTVMKALGAELPYVHQADCMSATVWGWNSLLATDTASGKSLGFIMSAIYKLRQGRGDGRVLAIYPTKALNNDQRQSWEAAMAAAGYKPEELGFIDGSVPEEERLAILSKARVVMMTPDVIHAWVMTNLEKPEIQAFFAKLNLKIIDEAHAYNGAFLTKFQRLLQRIKYMQQIFNPDYKADVHGQVIMATATLEDPKKFGETLLGQDVHVIDHKDDTASQFQQDFVVLKTKTGHQDRIFRHLTRALAQNPNTGTILAFTNSRLAANDTGRFVNRALGGDQDNIRFGVHRGGQTPEQRIAVEKGLNAKSVKGAAVTSSLALGVNISGIETAVVLVNGAVDLATIRQICGRIRRGGRVFFVVSEHEYNVKRRLFGTFKDFYFSKPSQPVFYQDNPKLIAEDAMCIAHEAVQLGAIKKPKAPFATRLVEATNRILQQATNDWTVFERQALPPQNIAPQKFHGLRSIDGNRDIWCFDAGTKRNVWLGNLTISQALIEAAPGSVIYIDGRDYRVKKWGEAHEQAGIHVRRLGKDELAALPKTRALVKTMATTYINDRGIRDGALKENPQGHFMADCHLTIDRTLKGFIEIRPGQKVKHIVYDDKVDKPQITESKHATRIRTEDYGGPRSHRIQTTGVVINMGDLLKPKQLNRLGDMLVRALCDECGISRSDVGFMVKDVRVGVSAKNEIRDRAIVVYDRTPGSLYYSGELYRRLDKIVDKMIEHIPSDDLEMLGIVTVFEDYVKTLKNVDRVPTYDEWLQKDLKAHANDNRIMVYAPGSELMWANGKGEDHQWVRVEEVKQIEFREPGKRNGPVIRELRYRVRPVTRVFSRPRKGEVTKHELRGKNGEVDRWILPGDLVRPIYPTYRLSIFDKTLGKCVEIQDQAKTNGQAHEPKRPSADSGNGAGFAAWVSQQTARQS